MFAPTLYCPTEYDFLAQFGFGRETLETEVVEPFEDCRLPLLFVAQRAFLLNQP
jgi:hypothetical protein